jgi:hypothetical protein
VQESFSLGKMHRNVGNVSEKKYGADQGFLLIEPNSWFTKAFVQILQNL